MAAVPSGQAAAVSAPLAPADELTSRLYERHRRQIFAFCLHQLGNREEAEDATQSTFLNAFRGLKRGTTPEFETAWLYKIAQNVCLNGRQSRSRRRSVEVAADFETIQETVPSPQSDSDELFHLTKALEVMPEQQRRALLLREWQGLAYSEIAEEMRLSQSAIETLLFRARRTLAQSLEAEPQARKRGRPRAHDAGQLAAVLKSLFVGGATKVAATALTVAATTAVATAPPVRHQLAQVFGSPPPIHPKQKADPRLVVQGLVQARDPQPRPSAAIALVAPAPAAVHPHHVTRPRSPVPLATPSVAAVVHTTAPRRMAPLLGAAAAPEAVAHAAPVAPVHHETPPAPSRAAPAAAPPPPVASPATTTTDEPPAPPQPAATPAPGVPAANDDDPPSVHSTNALVPRPAPPVATTPAATTTTAPVTTTTTPATTAAVAPDPAPVPAQPAAVPATTTTTDAPAPDPPGQAKKDDASATPPGQAKNDAATVATTPAPTPTPTATTTAAPTPPPPPAPATAPTTTTVAPASEPPGQAKKDDGTGAPPGQAKKGNG